MKTIAVDIDDVLAANAEAFVAYTNKKWGTNLTIDDYDEHWAKVWQVEHDEERKRVNEIYASGIFKKYRHFPEALPVLNELAQRYKLVVLTSRQKSLAGDTIDWVQKYFKNVFSEIHFSGIWDDWNKKSSEMIHHTKAEIAGQIGADYLIDDQLKHCGAAAGAGIKTILFGDYKWNQTKESLPKNMTRAKDWPEVLKYFNGQS